MRMQQELQEIIKRFESHYYNTQYQNKDIVKYYDEQDNHQFCNQQIMKLTNKTNLMEETIESLVYYGNRTHKFYEAVINETIINFNAAKDQKNEREQHHDIEILEAKRTIEQLGKRMQIMKQQIHNKQDNYKQLSQKYQELIERVNQANEEYEKHIQDIQANFKKQMHKAQALIESKDHLLLEKAEQNLKIIKYNAQVKAQSKLIKKQNQNLAKQNFALSTEKERLLIQNSEITNKLNSLKQQLDDILLLNEEFNYEDHKGLRLQERSKTTKTNKSRDMINLQKETLNISEHYIKSINTIQIKIDQSQQHILDIIPNKSRFAKHCRNKTAFINIQNQDINKQEKVEEPQNKPQEPVPAIVQNPYESFFSLLVQSQKLNSPYFNQVSGLNIKHLYDDFVQKLIPFNKWQAEIKKHLQSKIQQRRKNK